MHGETYKNIGDVDFCLGKIIEVECSVHGIFKINKYRFKNGSGCHQCWVSPKRIKIKDLIKRSKEIHNDFYNYHLVTDELSDEVTIECPLHGVFKQNLIKHSRGMTACKKCSNEKISSSKRYTKEDVIKIFKTKHGDKYDYVKFEEYKNSKSKITIMCPIHGEFRKGVNKHISGQGCPSCSSTNSNWKPPYFTLYYLKIKDRDSYQYKIGTTSYTIKRRYANQPHLKYNILGEWHFKSLSDAEVFEKSIINVYNDYRSFDKSLLESGYTELFSENVLRLP